MLVRNTNPQFGDVGPFETPSKERLADDMTDIFKVMAAEWVQTQPPEGVAWCAEDFKFAETRTKFIRGLEECEVESTEMTLIEAAKSIVLNGHCLEVPDCKYCPAIASMYNKPCGDKYKGNRDLLYGVRPRVFRICEKYIAITARVEI
jgi:hypothetical protein